MYGAEREMPIAQADDFPRADTSPASVMRAFSLVNTELCRRNTALALEGSAKERPVSCFFDMENERLSLCRMIHLMQESGIPHRLSR